MKRILYLICFISTTLLWSCNEEKLDIMSFGSVTGRVIDGDTYKPVEGVMVTTNPASISILTDATGKFTIPKLKEGEVAVTVKKKDYLGNTLSVAIYGDESTSLDFLIFKDENNIGNVNIYDPVPGNGALDQALGFLLKWKVEGKKSGTPLTYSIYIFESNSTVQKLVGEDISVQEVTVSSLKANTTYFWYVVAKYEGNKIAFSPTWSFVTRTQQ